MSMTPALQVVPEGEEGTTEFRLRFKDEVGNDVSPWHHIPLHTGEEGVFNVVIEIPKMTRAKFEVSTKERMNVIAQDVKKGKLRNYHGPIYWNYGMFPQTWENPNHGHPDVKCSGDNDPLDVVEIGSRVLKLGSVEQVKPLGVLAMIDDGELDWKIIAISVNDPMAADLDDISDVEEHCPGTISGIREWFRWYKTPDGKPLNDFAFEGNALDRDRAMDVIGETHKFWKELVEGHHANSKLWLPDIQAIKDLSSDDVASLNSSNILQPATVAGRVHPAKSMILSRL